MRCKLAVALVAVAVAGYAAWRYYDWAITQFDAREQQQ